MEGRPYISLQWRRVKELSPLWLIILLALSIRIYHSFHFLVSDEAFNLITIETLAAGNGLNEYFFRHPPLYLLISSLISYVAGIYPQVPSVISIVFSSLSIVPLYLIADLLMGRTVALWASLFFSVIPSNIFFSSWIKQDGMLLFFFMWAVYFYLKERFILAGISIGIALLVKEFALFFIPLSLLINKTVGSKDGKRFNPWYGWLKMAIIAAILSSWWYIKFGVSFYNIAGDAFTGGNIKELQWHYPWWFYIKNMVYELSYPLFLLFICGLVISVVQVYRYNHLMLRIVPLLWILALYVPLTLITVKAPWYSYLAMPPMAILAAFGMVTLVNKLKSKVSQLATYSLVMVSLVFVLYDFDKDSFSKNLFGFVLQHKDLQGNTWEEMLEKKAFWRKRLKGIERVGFLGFYPTLQYLAGIPTEGVVILRSSSVMTFDRERILNLSKELDIGAIIVNTEILTFTEKNLIDMTALWGEPDRTGNLLIFVTRPK